jgi:hypothetical protein
MPAVTGSLPKPGSHPDATTSSPGISGQPAISELNPASSTAVVSLPV